MDKKRILYVITQSEMGGAQLYLYDLATSSEAQNFDITVAIGKEGDGTLNAKLAEKNITVIELKHLVRPISPIQDIAGIFELKKIIKELQPDIIHLNSTKASIIGSLASLFIYVIRHKLVYTVHGWAFNESLNPIKKNFL